MESNRLDRAHIFPRCKGGSDGVENLHLLCATCHEDSEYLESPDVYMNWLIERTVIDKMFSFSRRYMGLSLAGLGRDGWNELARVALKHKTVAGLKMPVCVGEAGFEMLQTGPTPHPADMTVKNILDRG
jgi:hypothetical protein